MTTKTLERMQHLTMSVLEFKAADDGKSGDVSGVAAAYNVDVDRGWGLFMRLLPGAFSAQVKDPARVRLLWQHERRYPIGKVSSFEDSAKELRVAGRILASEHRPEANRALADLRDGLIDEFSVGFEMLKWKMVEEKADDGITKHVYEIEKARLDEISVVTWGALGAKARVKHVNDREGTGLTRQHAAAIRAEMARLRA